MHINQSLHLVGEIVLGTLGGHLDRDPVISVSEARMAAPLFQRGELFIIQRAKYAIMMERAVELCETTFEFLSDSDGTDPLDERYS